MILKYLEGMLFCSSANVECNDYGKRGYMYLMQYNIHSPLIIIQLHTQYTSL